MVIGLRDDELDNLRATVNQFLSDSVTIARNGVTVAARVVHGTRVEHLEGFPTTLGLPEWLITVPWDANVEAGDVFAARTAKGESLGTYLGLRVAARESNSTDTTVHALQQLRADGSAALPTNTTVSFVSKTGQTMLNPDDGSPNIPVYLFPQTQELVQGVKLAQGYTYVLIFDNRRRFPLPDSAGNLIRIQANDGVICDLFGQQPELLAQSIGITNPIPRGVLPVSQATFVVPS